MKNWYTIECKIREEFKVNDRLTNQGYESYLPVTNKDKRYLTPGATVKNILTALFPRYLFVRMNEGEDDFHPVSKTPGVIRIVKMTRRDDGYLYPTAVPEYVINFLKGMEDERGIRDTQENHVKGDVIRISDMDSPFYGLTAIVDGDPDERVIALLNIMGKLHKIPFDYWQVETA